MSVPGRTLRAICAAACAVALVTGCPGTPKGGPAAAPTTSPPPPPFDVETVQALLLPPEGLGTGWKGYDWPYDGTLPALCTYLPEPLRKPGDQVEPKTPGDPQVLTVTAKADVTDDGIGQERPRFRFQFALVYPDEDAAVASLAELRAVADACPKKVHIPRWKQDGRTMASYDEFVEVRPLTERDWPGFLVKRHPVYEKTTSTSDNVALAVLQNRNLVLLLRYYALSSTRSDPAFDGEWDEFRTAVLARFA
ncbi:hypothetical protein [Micromonospora vulcania]|uniref:Lipoprotein n=1 Tax=Micromonospora vulcania TaxID=1441873 RepID=A0ABW1H383_9ACTN